VCVCVCVCVCDKAELGGLVMAQQWTDAGSSKAGSVRLERGRLRETLLGSCFLGAERT
jgi:hypothetical protein